MLTQECQIKLMNQIKESLEESPGIDSQELYQEMFPGAVSEYDFDQCFQHVRSGHDIPKLPEAEPEAPASIASDPEPDIVSTQREAAERLDISVKTLKEWKKEPGYPDTKKGYDIPAIQSWRAELESSSEAEPETEKTQQEPASGE